MGTQTTSMRFYARQVLLQAVYAYVHPYIIQCPSLCVNPCNPNMVWRTLTAVTSTHIVRFRRHTNEVPMVSTHQRPPIKRHKKKVAATFLLRERAPKEAVYLRKWLMTHTSPLADGLVSMRCQKGWHACAAEEDLPMLPKEA